jgi:hypothetical protein
MNTKIEMRPLSVIGSEIAEAGRDSGWYWAAKPYVEAMCWLHSVNDRYGMDSGRSVVMYALANMQSWRGEQARSIKAELKAHLA